MRHVPCLCWGLMTLFFKSMYHHRKKEGGGKKFWYHLDNGEEGKKRNFVLN